MQADYTAKSHKHFNYDPGTGQVDEDPGLEVDKRTRKLLMTAARKLTYNEARDEVMERDPELAREYLNAPGGV